MHVIKQLGVTTWENKMSSSNAKHKAILTKLSHSSLKQDSPSLMQQGLVMFLGAEAEVKMAVMAASCNIPLAFHNQVSPAIRSLFPDSKIASKYHSASTKAMCMLNLAIEPELKRDLVENMKVQPLFQFRLMVPMILR